MGYQATNPFSKKKEGHSVATERREQINNFSLNEH